MPDEPPHRWATSHQSRVSGGQHERCGPDRVAFEGGCRPRRPIRRRRGLEIAEVDVQLGAWRREWTGVR